MAFTAAACVVSLVLTKEGFQSLSWLFPHDASSTVLAAAVVAHGPTGGARLRAPVLDRAAGARVWCFGITRTVPKGEAALRRHSGAVGISAARDRRPGAVPAWAEPDLRPRPKAQPTSQPRNQPHNKPASTEPVLRPRPTAQQTSTLRVRVAGSCRAAPRTPPALAAPRAPSPALVAAAGLVPARIDAQLLRRVPVARPTHTHPPASHPCGGPRRSTRALLRRRSAPQPTTHASRARCCVGAVCRGRKQSSPRRQHRCVLQKKRQHRCVLQKKQRPSEA